MMGVAGIINFITKNNKFLLATIVFILIILLLQQCNSKRKIEAALDAEKQKTAQNMAALNDSISKVLNKNGEEVYKKAIFNMSLDELKKYRPELYDDIKAQGGGVKTITVTKISYRDTGSVKNNLNKLGNDQYALPFIYASSDSLLKIKGRSMFSAKTSFADKTNGIINIDIEPGLTEFSDINIKFGIKTGIQKDNDGIDRIFITPSSNKITITSLEGADVSNYLNDKKPRDKKFSIGPYIGFGVNFNKTQVFAGPSIGVSLHYSVIKF